MIKNEMPLLYFTSCSEWYYHIKIMLSKKQLHSILKIKFCYIMAIFCFGFSYTKDLKYQEHHHHQWGEEETGMLT